LLVRRAAIVVALLAVLAIFAAPAAAQVQDSWFLSGGLGPAFGTLGSVPAVNGTGGYRFNEHISVAGEFGLLPHAPFDKAGVIAPAVSPLVPAAHLRVNGYHANGNVNIQPGIRGHVEPYATVGIGTFTGSTVAAAHVGPTEFRQYQNDTHVASNFGAGLTYRFNRWFGVNADYRHFIVNATDREHLNRFATGVRVFVK
jgi:opacity protein-like surface antigen